MKKYIKFIRKTEKQYHFCIYFDFYFYRRRIDITKEKKYLIPTKNRKKREGGGKKK